MCKLLSLSANVFWVLNGAPWQYYSGLETCIGLHTTDLNSTHLDERSRSFYVFSVTLEPPARLDGSLWVGLPPPMPRFG